MLSKVETYLLVDTNTEFTQAFASFYFAPEECRPSNLVVAGDNTRLLVKMMFQELIKDYSYCDISNEISVSELASYLHEHHVIAAVLINAHDYKLADDEQRFIFNSLHPVRFLVEENESGEFYFERLLDTAHDNHLSCSSMVAEATDDISESLCKLASEEQL